VKLAIATDHRGLALKDALVRALAAAGHELRDLGSHGPEAVDYPDFAIPLAEMVARGEVERGILICGTGIGMSIAANKVPGAMAALVYDEASLKLSREHNDANILVLPGNWLTPETAASWVQLWLELPFAGGRHAPRVARIEAYDQRRGPVPEAAD
jgi:ribose 5-phosphate isomerase B